MLRNYHDITSLIQETPQWWDDNGVPRYCEFAPNKLGVYIDFAVLIQISCQDCHKLFNVGCGYDKFWVRYFVNKNEPKIIPDSLEQIIGRFHYGDPPAHGCVGDTMNCIDEKVLEAWQNVKTVENGVITDWAGWTRFSEYEKEIGN